MKKLAIVILAFNESFSLEQTVKEILALDLKCLSRIVISTSKDASKECQQTALALTCEFEIVEIYFQKKPYVAAAVMEVVSALNEALCVYMSADKETPVEVIPKMLNAIEIHDSDIISGSRWIEGGSFLGYGRMKHLISLSAQLLCKTIYQVKLTEFTYGYRLYKTEVLMQCDFQEKRHPFFLESLLVPLRLGFDVYEVPVKWTPRTEGKSIVNILTLISYLRPTIGVLFRPKRRLVRPIII